jgi:TonB family protein
MRREHTTPIVLWLGAALWLHVLLGRGGDELAEMHEGATTLRDLASKVRRDVRGKDRPLELEALLEAPPEEAKAKAEEERREAEKKAAEEAKREKPEDAPKPEPEKKVAEVPKPTVPAPVTPVPLDPKKRDKRIAIDQHVKPSAEDNPTANFVADEAVKVDEETVAKQTHQGEDQPDPNPGGAHVDDRVKEPGNASRDRVAQQEDVAGTKERSSGERGASTDLAPPPVAPPSGRGTDDARGKAGTVDVARGDQSKLPPQAAVAEHTPRSDGDGWRFDPMAKGAQASRGTGSVRDGKVGEVGKPNAQWLGLGSEPGDGRPNLNLSHAGVASVIGEDQLRRDRMNDGERRRSEHRGTWQPSSLERWRSATENYVSSVKVGNQTALNAARVPFASYLHAIHNRIHPIFADAFLGSLSGLPPTHPLNDLKMQTHLEIVLSPRGEVVKMGIVRSSGVTAFDIAALDSVQRASPFGTAPPAIFSGDGNVYLHWEFHRDEVFACSTMNARPFILVSPPPIGPVKPVPSREQGPPEPLPPYAPGAERFGYAPASGNQVTLALFSHVR